MRPLLVAMPGNEKLTEDLAATLSCDVGNLEIRAFPDGETYLRFITSPANRTVALVCTLSQPNGKMLPLLFASATARELGAAQVGLVAPYLAYMRQDRRFKPGEAVTSREIARLLSDAFDWLVTVDPHLHRESEQWVAAVASDAGVPYSVLEKVRRGDRNVEIRLKDLGQWKGRTPVLVDDIISTGRTMIEAVRLLSSQGWSSPICVAVHGLFADDVDVELKSAGARVVTSNSVPHSTNAIGIGEALAQSIATEEIFRN